MEKIRDRFPSRQDALLVLLVCAFPIFIWSLIHAFVEIPAWLIRSNTWDLIGMTAYTQAFALFESLIIWLILIVIGIILPGKIFRDRFVAYSAIIVFTTTVWFILIHLNDEKISDWGGRQFIFWALIFVSTIIIMYFLVYRFEKLGSFIDRVCNRLSVLSIIYLVIGLISLIIVFIRNLF